MRLRVLAVLAAAALGPLAASSGRAGESHRVALLPIAVHSASADSAYLSDGLAEMLTARLERSGRISVVRIESNSRTTTKAPVAVEAGRAAGAEYVVFGSFTQFGEGASLDVQCARVAGAGEGGDAPRRVFVQSGSVAEIIPRLDDLAEKIARYVTGRATPAAEAPAQAVPAEAGELTELRQRLEALERAVYVEGAASRQAAPEASAAAGVEAAGAGSGAAPVR